MTFLELCQRTASEGGIEGALATVDNQSGMNAKIIKWVRDAWSELQTQKRWLFMRANANVALIVAQNDYSISGDLGLTNVTSRCLPKFFATDADGAYQIAMLGYGEYQQIYMGKDIQAARPSVCAVAPGYRLVFNNAPTIATTIKNDYWMTPQKLTLDADEPNMNEAWHMAIVFKALRSYAEHEESPEMQRRARRQFMNIFTEMCKVELPQFEIRPVPMARGVRDA